MPLEGESKRATRPELPPFVKPPPHLPGRKREVSKSGEFPKLPPKPIKLTFPTSVSTEPIKPQEEAVEASQGTLKADDMDSYKPKQAKSVQFPSQLMPEMEDKEALAFWKLRGKNKKQALKKEASRWGKRGLIALAVMTPVVLAMSLFQFNSIPSASMEPTVGKTDIVVSWRFGDKSIERGDIVVFNGSGTDWGNKLYLKRVIGVSGDKLKCCEAGGILVNDEKLEEPYIKGKSSKIGFQHKVKEGSFFALGDNRDDSEDSRYHVDAYIPEDSVVAKPFMGFSLSGFRFYSL